MYVISLRFNAKSEYFFLIKALIIQEQANELSKCKTTNGICCILFAIHLNIHTVFIVT
jgi:hypothetical protein